MPSPPHSRSRLAFLNLPILLLLPGLTTPLTAAPQKSGAAQAQEKEKEKKPAKTPAGKSVKPGINKGFLSKKASVKKYAKTFESESREVFAHRHRIMKHLGIEPGMNVADIGAGTGLFLDLFAKGVGKQGLLFAVDIAPKFIAHLSKRAKAKKLHQVLPVQCTGTSAELPAASVDIAFTCDTYHHFEYPPLTLATLMSAIRPGGQLIVVDFERIPGVSRKFIMGHVRCNKETVIKEITKAGFRFEAEIKVKGLKENYFLRFRRPGRKAVR